MDARRIAVLGVVCLAALVSAPTRVALAQRQYQATSANFVVTAVDQQFAYRTAELAEQYRKDLANQWLGRELAPWQEKCPISVEFAQQAGGETTFTFTGPPGSGEPSGWIMKIFGSPERVLDSVLPHEITHTVFATHFGQPLPRWADEGACTTVEHHSERTKIHALLLQFLTGRPSRGIPFNQMFTMKQYPAEMLPLYAQSYSVARYLIQQRGHQHFIRFVQSGLDAEQINHPLRAWDLATRQYYGYEDLSDLQVSWQQWVADGSPDRVPVESAIASAGVDRLPIAEITAQQPQFASATANGPGRNENGTGAAPAGMEHVAMLPPDSWYRQQLLGNSPASADATAEENGLPTPQSLRRIDSLNQSSPSAATSFWR